MTELRIPARFNGPSGSGNGGYVAGLVAHHCGAVARSHASSGPDAIASAAAAPVRVTLRAPAPLDVPLVLRTGGLYDGDTVIAEAAPGGFERAVPDAVSFDDADAASAAYRNDSEMFRYCFVCGTARQDGLGLAPGAVRAGLVAAPWVPGDSLPIDPTLLWAAMDCPGGWALPEMLQRPALLGSMTANVFALPEVGEKCVVVGADQGEQGRKSFASTAVYGTGGRLLGRAEQIWIRLNRA
ncbi:hypothetical protein [Nocardia cyriacigeorgica]|uniref:hypothetical protein n=1 Tax=Nocardia cyriacigeorgica TaxID=135487 RepID=UPI0018946961|nr:hypothetical protein [Nocardia cyriacigeorgica]MBF6457239.1 hypothetical protein [Nocardia cyriacigeorgica]MBF6480497.1 hypothetical protein [Nocardia cyriacigeorgica]MBF6554422.1 hypothetical protein [Nocardia cyriacigeorgica]